MILLQKRFIKISEYAPKTGIFRIDTHHHQPRLDVIC